MLLSLIEIDDHVTTESWAEYSAYIRQLSERGSPDLPRRVRIK